MGFGGTSEGFIQGALIFGAIAIFLMPVMISVFMSPDLSEIDTDPLVSEETIEDFNTAYTNFTSNGSKKEQPWALTGIFTPYSGGTYHYTPDGWLYGELITSYSPTQYTGRDAYTVVRGMNGVENTPGNETGVIYTYATNNTMNGNNKGDAYTYVTMDVSQQSDIFFTDQLKRQSGQGFYYEYTGYRYSFQPLESGYTQYTDADGNKGITKMNATTSSMSLIWYNFATQSGISGQLILSGSDYGVSYLTAADIVSAFSSATNTARFEMTFNGVPMFIYIQIDPSKTYQGVSVEECYNSGYWSIMVSSLSTDPNDYYTSGFSFSPEKILDTAIALLTFNLDEYDMSPTMRVIASVVFDMVLLTMLLAIGLKNPQVLVIAGIAALIVAGQDFITEFISIITEGVNAFVQWAQGIIDGIAGFFNALKEIYEEVTGALSNWEWPPDVDVGVNPDDWDWWPF